MQRSHAIGDRVTAAKPLARWPLGSKQIGSKEVGSKEIAPVEARAGGKLHCDADAQQPMTGAAATQVPGNCARTSWAA